MYFLCTLSFTSLLMLMYLMISQSPFNKLIKMKFAIWSTCCKPLNLVHLAALVCCRFSHVLRQP